MPQLRTDIVDVYVFRRAIGGHVSGGVELLQLRRAKGALSGTWQPVMGHAATGETAAETALRELAEETGFSPDTPEPARRVLNLWQIEELNAYFLASKDAIVLSPCFVAEVPAGAEPVLNDEHDAARWVRRDHADRMFLWPGQRQAIRAIFRDILAADSPLRDAMRIRLE